MQKKINKMYAQINEHKNYLDTTDYKIIKGIEINEIIDNNIHILRQKSRDEINKLYCDISLLEDQMKEEEINIQIIEDDSKN